MTQNAGTLQNIATIARWLSQRELSTIYITYSGSGDEGSPNDCAIDFGDPVQRKPLYDTKFADDEVIFIGSAWRVHEVTPNMGKSHLHKPVLEAQNIEDCMRNLLDSALEEVHKSGYGDGEGGGGTLRIESTGECLLEHSDNIKKEDLLSEVHFTLDALPVPRIMESSIQQVMDLNDDGALNDDQKLVKEFIRLASAQLNENSNYESFSLYGGERPGSPSYATQATLTWNNGKVPYSVMESVELGSELDLERLQEYLAEEYWFTHETGDEDGDGEDCILTLNVTREGATYTAIDQYIDTDDFSKSWDATKLVNRPLKRKDSAKKAMRP